VATFQIQLLSSFGISRDGQRVDLFRARTEERLLAYLALQPGAYCSRSEIVEAFWPDEASVKARKWLSLYLFQLKQRLSAIGMEDAIEDSREALRLGPEIRTDAQDFAELVLAGSLAQSTVERTRMLLEAVEMYGSGLLPGYGYEWVDAPRRQLGRVYAQAIARLAKAFDPSGDMHELLSALPPTSWRGLVRLREPGSTLSVTEEVLELEPDDRSVLIGVEPGIVPFVQEWTKALNGPNRREALARLTDRLPEIRGLFANPPNTAGHAERLSVAASLWRYWFLSGQMAEGRSYLDELLAPGLESPPPVQAAALHAAGTLANLEGDRGVGIQRLTEAAALWHVLGSDSSLLSTLINLAGAVHDEGRFDEARTLHTQAVGIARRLKAETSLSRALYNSALTELKLGNAPHAVLLLQERLALPSAASDPAVRGVTKSQLASAALIEEDLDTAHYHAREALNESELSSDSQVQALAHSVMGRVLQLSRHLEEARDHFLISIEHARAGKDMGMTGRTLGYLATVYEQLGESELAALCTVNATVLMQGAGSTDALIRFELEFEQLKRDSGGDAP